MAKYDELKQLIKDGEEEKVPGVVRAFIDAGSTPTEIMSEGLIAGMSVVSEKFKSGEMYIPEVLIATDAMTAGMGIIKPLIVKDESQSLYSGKAVAGTVKGDIHDMGKKIVAMLLESNGFEIIDLGVDVSTEKFLEAVKREQPDLLLLSALLTTTMSHMGEVIAALEELGLRNKVKVLVGGVSVTNQFANSIGADGFAPDGHSAIDKVKELLDKP